MRAIVYESGGVEALAIREIPEPQPGPGEVLLRVKACAMNHLDVWATKNPTEQRFGGPRIMGSDVAGVVEALGPGVTGYSLGDRVLVDPGVSCRRCLQCQRGRHSNCSEYKLIGVHLDGGYSELMPTPAVNLAHLPDSISFEDGASIPLVFITAWRTLVEKANVQPGEWVLVNAAGSGVGIAAIQIAKLFGARVIATASTETKRTKALGLGADGAVDYTQPGWPQEVERLADGRGADVAIDCVGGTILAETLGAMASGGRVVNCGFTAGAQWDFDWSVFRGRQLSFAWSMMGGNSYLHEVMRFARTGQLKSVVHRVFPFEQVQEAHRAMIDRENFGKIVLTW
jgi:NADPH:quinone reductase-like Zn-dependent oxidoreductase